MEADEAHSAAHGHRISQRLDAAMAAFVATAADAFVTAAGESTEARLEALRAAVEERLAAFAAYQHDQLAMLDTRLDDVERSALDLIGETETRLRSDIGALDSVRDEVDSLRTETTRTRDELERLRDEHLEGHDRLLLRIADLEARAAERLDVNAAVQIERLDEIERQLLALDPGVGADDDPGAGAVVTADITSRSPVTGASWHESAGAPQPGLGRRPSERTGAVVPPPSMRLTGRHGDPDARAFGIDEMGARDDRHVRSDGREVVGGWDDDPLGTLDSGPWQVERNPFAGS